MMTRLMLAAAALLTAFIAATSHAGDDDLESGTIGTGIMGVITGFGSIHVNGFQIDVPNGLVATSSLGARPVDSLRIGETVVVDAELDGDDLTATRIRNYYPIIAPVEAISPGRVRVLGLDLDASEVELDTIEAGDWLAISGLWRGSTVVVSDLQRIAPRREVVVNGTFFETDTGTQLVGPFALDGRYVEHAVPGDHIRLTGVWSEATNTIAPLEIVAGLFPPELRTLLIEGYMSQPDPKGAYSIYGSGIVVYTDDTSMQVPSNRSIFCVNQSGPVSITQSLELELPRVDRIRLLEDLSVNSAEGLSIDLLCRQEK